MNVICKHCGSDEICGGDSVLVSAQISGWQKSAAGGIEPIWSGDSEVHWDSQTPEIDEKPYYCGNCSKYLGDEDLVIDEEEETEEPV